MIIKEKREDKSSQSQEWKRSPSTDLIDIRRTVKEHYKQFPIKRCESLAEIDKIFGKFNLPKLPKKKHLNSYNYSIHWLNHLKPS